VLDVSGHCLHTPSSCSLPCSSSCSCHQGFGLRELQGWKRLGGCLVSCWGRHLMEQGDHGLSHLGPGLSSLQKHSLGSEGRERTRKCLPAILGTNLHTTMLLSLRPESHIPVTQGCCPRLGTATPGPGWFLVQLGPQAGLLWRRHTLVTVEQTCFQLRTKVGFCCKSWSFHSNNNSQVDPRTTLCTQVVCPTAPPLNSGHHGPVKQARRGFAQPDSHLAITRVQHQVCIMLA
jgi:hypothetical protein